METLPIQTANDVASTPPGAGSTNGWPAGDVTFAVTFGHAVASFSGISQEGEPTTSLLRTAGPRAKDGAADNLDASPWAGALCRFPVATPSQTPSPAAPSLGGTAHSYPLPTPSEALDFDGSTLPGLITEAPSSNEVRTRSRSTGLGQTAELGQALLPLNKTFGPVGTGQPAAFESATRGRNSRPHQLVNSNSSTGPSLPQDIAFDQTGIAFAAYPALSAASPVTQPSASTIPSGQDAAAVIDPGIGRTPQRQSGSETVSLSWPSERMAGTGDGPITGSLPYQHSSQAPVPAAENQLASIGTASGPPGSATEELLPSPLAGSLPSQASQHIPAGHHYSSADTSPFNTGRDPAIGASLASLETSSVPFGPSVVSASQDSTLTSVPGVAPLEASPRSSGIDSQNLRGQAGGADSGYGQSNAGSWQSTSGPVPSMEAKKQVPATGSSADFGELAGADANLRGSGSDPSQAGRQPIIAGTPVATGPQHILRKTAVDAVQIPAASKIELPAALPGKAISHSLQSSAAVPPDTAGEADVQPGATVAPFAPMTTAAAFITTQPANPQAATPAPTLPNPPAGSAVSGHTTSPSLSPPVGGGQSDLSDSSSGGQGNSAQNNTGNSGSTPATAPHLANNSFPDSTLNVLPVHQPSAPPNHEEISLLPAPPPAAHSPATLSAWQNYDGGAGSIVRSASLGDSSLGAEMHVELRSGVWGPLEVHAVMHDGSLGAEIRVQGQEAHTLLAAGLPTLERALGERNLRVENLNVFQDQAGGGMSGGGKQDSQSGSSPSPQRQAMPWDNPSQQAGPSASANEEFAETGGGLSVRA